jgi:hypothetical protein
MCEECPVFEGETGIDLVKSILGLHLKDKEAHYILWEWTAFPFGDAQIWARQLIEFRLGQSGAIP